MKFSRIMSLILAGLGALAGCAAEPADGPGLCKLRCSDSIIGASDFDIEPITNDLSLKCLNTLQGETRILTSKFLITRKRQTGNGTEDVAVPNVSVRPVIIGLYDDTYNEGNVPGAVTKESNFCSDQCGIVTLDFSVVCPDQGDGEVTVSVMSGALRPQRPMRVTIQSATFEEVDDDDAPVNNNSGNDNSNN